MEAAISSEGLAMITRGTVLVLGAGASMPYGFPSGLALLKLIQKRSGEGHFRQSLLDAGCGGYEIDMFNAAVIGCGRSSIDAFLESRPDLVHVGRTAIALTLFPFENEEKLYNPQNSNEDIYRYLFSRLSDGLSKDEFRQHRLAVITYNYDRSFEHYMFRAISSSYGVRAEEARDILNEALPVIHVHGRLGALPWENTSTACAFGEGMPAGLVRVAADQIRIISEADVDGGPEYANARRALASARIICFLGFGYNALNVERLRVEDWKEEAVYGTCCGLSPIEVDQARKVLHQKLNSGHKDHRCVEYLRGIGPLL